MELPNIGQGTLHGEGVVEWPDALQVSLVDMGMLLLQLQIVEDMWHTGSGKSDKTGLRMAGKDKMAYPGLHEPEVD